MAQPELRLQISVVDFLRWSLPPQVLWWHTPNGGSRDRREAAKLKAMGVTAGVPDLCFVLPHGQAGFIELKADRGRVSPAQSEWMKAAQLAGARVAVCRSLSDVQEALSEWIAPLQLSARVAA